MRPLVLVAASGLAREVLETVRDRGTHDVVGIVDDDPTLRGRRVLGIPVLGGLDALAGRPDVDVLICAGRGAARRAIANRLGLPDRRYATVVHPTVAVPSSCSVGAGTILLAGSVLTASVTIGRHVCVMPHVTLTHDDVVADFATLCAGVTLAGRVHIGTGAYIGMQAGVREGVAVGADAVVAMGAVIIGDVPPEQTWAGVPARPLRLPTLSRVEVTL